MSKLFGFFIGTRNIDIEINLPSPKFPKWLTSDQAFYRDWVITTNKSFEIQYSGDWDTLFNLDLNCSRKEDHAGCAIAFGFMRRWVRFSFYDRRHWNEDENRWQTKEDIDEMLLSEIEANLLIDEVVDNISKDPTKINKALRKLKYDELKFAVISKLIDKHYTTLAKEVCDLAYAYALKNAWWIRRDHPARYVKDTKKNDD